MFREGDRREAERCLLYYSMELVTRIRIENGGVIVDFGQNPNLVALVESIDCTVRYYLTSQLQPIDAAQ